LIAGASLSKYLGIIINEFSTYFQLLKVVMKAITIRLIILVVLLLVITIVGTFGFSRIEHLSLGDAFYFTVVTIATVGYGDIYPTTTAGKVLAIVLIIVGVAAFTGVIVDGSGWLLERRRARARYLQSNVLFGLFLNEAGYSLLKQLAACDPSVAEIRRLIQAHLPSARSARMHQSFLAHNFVTKCSLKQLTELRTLLEANSSLLLRLVENPVSLEQEKLMATLQTAIHLREELVFKRDLDALRDKDLDHFAKDASKAYRGLAITWLDYLEYLRQKYPYLYNRQLEDNPFNEIPGVTD
jgi:voltage-gated potassium channel